MSAHELTEGWGWPALSRKAHYFTSGEIRAVCLRWAYSGPRDQGNDTSPDNCAACKKWKMKRDARLEKTVIRSG